MLLAIDVGNTHTVLGLIKGDDIAYMWRVATHHEQTADQMRVLVLSLLSAEGLSPHEVDSAVLATVVPTQRRLWKQVVKDAFGAELFVIDASSAAHIIDFSEYPAASLMGADRVADAVAAFERYGGPVIVIDFGTATNMEVVDAHGVFKGGIIAPGIETSVAALFKHAALLPEVELRPPAHALGQNTIEAIQSGIVLGEVDRVDGLVHRIWEEMGGPTRVVATGGLAHVISPLSQTVTDLDQQLTLRGLQLLAQNRIDN